MNFTPVFGWYYISPNEKSPSWTGVPYLFDFFLTRTQTSVGPAGQDTDISQIEPGDVLQLSFDGIQYKHTPSRICASACHAGYYFDCSP